MFTFGKNGCIPHTALGNICHFGRQMFWNFRNILVYKSHYAHTYFGYLGLSTLEATRLHVICKVEFLNSVVT